jgi:hypothetical protein
LNTGESGVDALIAEGTPILVASLVGAGKGLALARALGLGTFGRGSLAVTAGHLGGALGESLASPNEAATILVGENAMIPILRGIDLEDSSANDVLEARINIFVDSLLTGSIAGTGIMAASSIASGAYGLFARPVVDVVFRRDAAIEDRVVNSILDELANMTSGLSLEQLNDPSIRFQIKDRLTDLIEENREVVVRSLNSANEELPMTLDSMTSLLRGLDETLDASMIGRAESLRSGVIQSGGMDTLGRANQPVDTLRRETEQYLESVGGATAREQTDTMLRSADELAESGRRQVAGAQEGVEGAQQAYDRASRELLSDLSNDVELSDEIRRLAGSVGTEIDISRTASREQIRSQIEAGYVLMRDRKNELYDAISGGAIDTGSLLRVLKTVNIDELSNMASVLDRASPLRNIVDVFRDAGAGSRPDSEVIERVNAWFARDPDMYNFGYFHNRLRPELSQLADDLFGSNQGGAGSIVRQIVRVIDSDMVDFVGRNDPNLAAAAREAKNFYTDEFAPLFREGRLREFSELYENTRTRGIRETDFVSGSRQIVDNTITSGDEALIRQFRDLLARPEAGGDPNPIASYMIADTISRAADSLRMSGGADANLTGFSSQLRQYSEALNELFGPRADELNRFITQVEAAQGNRQQLQRVLNAAQDNLRDVLNDVRTGELSAFFRRELQGSSDPLLRDLATASDPQAAFARVLASNRSDTTATVAALVERANSLPPAQRQVVMDGMETAYMRLFRERAFNYTRESAGTRPVNPTRIEVNLEEMQPLLRVGDEIYRDRPEFMEAMRAMADLARASAASRNATPVSAVSATEFNRQASSATNRLIQASIGPLTRGGTRIRTAVGAGIEARAPDAALARIMDRIMADPNYFVTLSRRYNRQPNDPVAREQLLRALIPASVRPTTEDDGSALMSVAGDGLNRLLGGAANAEINARNVIDQTEEALRNPATPR